MLKKTITYTDYNDVQRTEDFYFSISKAELIEMEFSTSGGMTQKYERLYQKMDAPEIMKTIKDIVRLAICEKSPDGKRLIKNSEIADNFFESEAWSVLLMELLSDENKANDFIKAILPKVDPNPIPIPANK